MKRKILISLRVVMGFIFLWAFFDKLLGLGFATKAENAWIHGISPTTGFLSFAARGPFGEIFHALSGLVLVDWLFMLGLLFVGVTLIFNKYVKWGTVVGGGMLMLMYLALLWPENNPIIDDHIVYTLVLALIFFDKENS